MTRARKRIGRPARMAALFWVALGATAAPAAELALHLRVAAPLGPDRVAADVVAAIDPAASAGYDPGVDDVAYRVGPLQAWFLDPAAPAPARYLKVDVRAGAGAEVWTLQVATPLTGTGDGVTPGDPVTLSWDPPATGETCTSRRIQLLDGSGGVADMGPVSTYTFAAPGADRPYTLELVIGAPGSAANQAPAAPQGLVSPQQGRRGVLLMWAPVAGDGVAYHVERVNHPTDGGARSVVRLTGAPLRETRWLDAGMVGQAVVAYRVVAVSGSGCESAPSEELLIAP
ncbi:MAG: hypothetical protein HZA24_01005 [Nitrospirae bacterium]|nr:hypothetical protein [Nitrospirota bacterium]